MNVELVESLDSVLRERSDLVLLDTVSRPDISEVLVKVAFEVESV
jgi:hypothetical protein